MLEHEISQVVDLRDNHDKTFREIGDILGFSETTAKRRYRAGLLQETATELVEGEFPVVQDLSIPEDITHMPVEGIGLIERFAPMVVEGNAFVTSDWHIPLHDPELMNRMFDHAVQSETKKLIINGDFWHMETFSSFLPHQPEASIETERYHGNIAIKIALDIFDEVYFNLGNHDFRIAKRLGFKKSYEECMEWMFFALTEKERARLHVSSLDYLHYFPGDGRQYRVCHPGNFSTIPLAVPRALAVKYNMSIITGHSHHLAMGVAQDGHNLIMESGGFFSPERTEYIQSTRKGHQWSQGWIQFTDGTPYLRGPRFNNVWR